MSRLPYILSTAGLLLILASWIWKDEGSTKLVWSDQQAWQHTQLAAEVHRLTHQSAHGAHGAHGDCPDFRGKASENGTVPFGRTENATRPPAARERLQKHGAVDREAMADTMRRYEASKRDLDSARSLHLAGIGMLRWTGSLVCLAGGFVWLWRRAPARKHRL